MTLTSDHTVPSDSVSVHGGEHSLSGGTDDENTEVKQVDKSDDQDPDQPVVSDLAVHSDDSDCDRPDHDCPNSDDTDCDDLDDHIKEVTCKDETKVMGKSTEHGGGTCDNIPGFVQDSVSISTEHDKCLTGEERHPSHDTDTVTCDDSLSNIAETVSDKPAPKTDRQTDEHLTDDHEESVSSRNVNVVSETMQRKPKSKASKSGVANTLETRTLTESVMPKVRTRSQTSITDSFKKTQPCKSTNEKEATRQNAKTKPRSQ